MTKIVNKKENKSNGPKPFKSMSCVQRKVIQQNYKRYLQNKNPNEKGSDISRGGDFCPKSKK